MLALGRLLVKQNIMSSYACWRCLSRAPELAIHTYRSTSHPPFSLGLPLAHFSTSPPALGVPAKKKSSVDLSARNESQRGVKRFIKKKEKSVEEDRSKRPKIGERKALRKRVVLSNTNALEVDGLQNITDGYIVDDELRGQVLAIPGPVVDQLRAVDAFKASQGWSLFRRPAMLIRQETIDLGKQMRDIATGNSKTSIRRILVGEKGSGKTLMLLQAMTMAFMKGWVVINIPHGKYINLPSPKSPQR